VQEKSIEEDEINLFNPTVLDRLPISDVAGLLIRPLKSTDYDKGNQMSCHYRKIRECKNNLL